MNFFPNFFSQIFFHIYKKLDIIKKNKEKNSMKVAWKISYWRWKKQKREYGHEGYKNLSEDEKQRQVEYRKRCYEMRKNKKLL